MQSLGYCSPNQFLPWEEPRDMRGAFWTHIRESKQRLQEEHPDKSKTDILQMARAECNP